MALLDLESLATPLSPDAPCGPDLDFEGDMEFMNFVARIDGILPSSYFSFDRNSIDFPREFDTIRTLSERTHDLRLIVLHAKLAILSRDVSTFAAAVDTIAALLEQHWDDIHPRGEDGDYLIRVATIQALDDAPHVVLPLQYAPLFENRRYGVFNWRAQMIVAGAASAREGETLPDGAAIERILLETEIADVVARRDEIGRIADAAERLQSVSIDRGGYENQIVLERLKPLAEDIRNFLDRHIGSRDPALALNPPDGAAVPDDSAEAAAGDAGGSALPIVVGAAAVPASQMPGAIATRKDAIRALDAAAAYFERYEPSSPSLLLIRYAINLIGKPFYDVVRTLMPSYASRAALLVGQNSVKLTVEHLADKTGDRSSSGDDDGEGEPPEPIAVHSRKDALRLLDLVVAYLRSAEPSSPIPMLISRARDVAERDFLNLMKDLFNEYTLKSIRGDD